MRAEGKYEPLILPEFMGPGRRLQLGHASLLRIVYSAINAGSVTHGAPLSKAMSETTEWRVFIGNSSHLPTLDLQDAPSTPPRPLRYTALAVHRAGAYWRVCAVFSKVRGKTSLWPATGTETSIGETWKWSRKMAEATGNSPVFYRAKYSWIVFSQVEDVFHPYDHKNIQSIKPFLAKLVTKCK